MNPARPQKINTVIMYVEAYTGFQNANQGVEIKRGLTG